MLEKYSERIRGIKYYINWWCKNKWIIDINELEGHVCVNTV